MARRSALNNILPLLDRLEPQVADAFVAAIFAAREGLDVRALQSALEAGDLARAVDLLAMPQGLLFPLDNALTNAFATGGALVTESARRAGVVFGFDGRHPQAEAWARQHIGGLITGIADESREAVTVAVRDALERQLVQGIGPRNAALDLVGRVDKATGRRVGGIVGLDGPRAERLRIVGDAMRTPEGVRSLVQGGKVKYKVNRATEARILRAYNAGTAVSERDRVLSLKQYGNQLLQQRGETISRTETITALRQGRREGFKQAVEQGKVDPDAITREWDATLDKRTRPEHAAMDGEKIDGLDEAWVLPDGSRMMTPGDSSLGASAGQIINCRCYENIRVDWLRKSSEEAGAAEEEESPRVDAEDAGRAFEIEDYDVVGREGDFTYAENRIPAYTEHDTSGVMEGYRHDQEIEATFREMAVENEVVFGEQEIQLSDLTSFQSTVRLENLQPILENFDLGQFVGADPATVFILPDGRFVLRDGNHRINAALANRVRSAKFQTIQFKPRSGRMPGYDAR